MVLIEVKSVFYCFLGFFFAFISSARHNRYILKVLNSRNIQFQVESVIFKGILECM